MGQYLNVDENNYFSGQSEELQPAAPAAKDERLLVVIETNVDTHSGEKEIIHHFNADN